MDQSRYRQLRRIFEEVAVCPAKQQSRRLDTLCGSDAALRAEVEELLTVSANLDGFLELPAGAPSESATTASGSALPRLPDGKVLGDRFEILELIGKGGMGEVYRAYDRHLNRAVAIKVLSGYWSRESDGGARLIREAQAVSRLNQPNIAVVFDVCRTDAIDYLSMELVDGQSLAELLRNGPLPLPQVIDYAIQIAGALVAAHEGGIIHRDLKPTNIMVAANASVKLLDFGTARAPDRAGIQSSLAGTLPYMAPEQLRGAGASAQSDIFSFGCVLYEMVIGRRAFPQTSTAAVLAALFCEEPAPLRMRSSAASRDVQQLIAACLNKDPDERLQNLREALKSLREIRDRIVPLPPAQHRRYRLSQALAAAACATTVWLMVSSWQTRQAVSMGDLRPIPLTTYPGSEESGSFSPNGKQVAFTWDGEQEDNADVYVKSVHTGAARRLTNDPAPDLMPAWSPDGRQIAFIRRRRGSIDILTQSPEGGDETIQGHSTCSVVFAPFLSWSPDSNSLAFPDRADPKSPCAMFLLSLHDHSRRQLTWPNPTGADLAPSFSRDGKRLVFSRGPLDSSDSDLFLLDLAPGYVPAGQPVQLTHTGTWVPHASWTVDGAGLVFSTGPWGGAELWRLPLHGARAPVRLAWAGEAALAPAIASTGNRLLFTRDLLDINIWRVGTYDSKETADHGSGEMWISSTRLDQTPQYSPDGDRIAFASNRDGSWEIWTCDRNRANARRITHVGGSLARSPAWSPDAASIAFDLRSKGQSDIYVARVDGGDAVPLTQTPDAYDITPAFSRDGAWMYYSSNRTGRYEVWKIPARRAGPAVQVTRDGGYNPTESTDGRTLYFVRQDGIFALSVESPEQPSRRVLAVRPESGSYAVNAYALYWIENAGDARRLRRFDLATAATSTITTIRPRVHVGMSVSPDDRDVLFSQVDRSTRDLMLVENFR